MSIPDTLNADYIEAQYQQWKADNTAVPGDWDAFFKGVEFAGTPGAGRAGGRPAADALNQARVERLISRYRDIGHLLACMDPLAECPLVHPLLDPAAFDLDAASLTQAFHTTLMPGETAAPLEQIIAALKETYCRSIGVEYMHLQDPDERRWLQDKMEPARNRAALTHRQRLRILEKLVRAARFEKFLNTKYVGVTRFSLEGGDALIPLLDTLLSRASETGCSEIILGMAHRGRLNVQANILQKPVAEILSEFESCYSPDDLVGAGDVKYHNGYLADLTTAAGKSLRVLMAHNPSHLEAVDPVVQGIARARQELRGDDARKQVLPVLIHGDAAFAGQGIVTETLNMSQLGGYTTGGSVHLVINNQIGYTTLPADARSTRYATDVAKMLMAPIFHVHGEDPEAAVHAAVLAADYRATFGKDVVIDLVCYRRFGHNEGDEPYFTQPLMYERIRNRPSLHRSYAETLLAAEDTGDGHLAAMEKAADAEFEAAYKEIHGSACPFPENRYFENWQGYHGKWSFKSVQTGVRQGRLRELAAGLAAVDAPDFHLHPKIEALLKKRLTAVESGTGVDWANAEALAFASLLVEGVPIRLSGQDVARGTFSQRHSALTDSKTERRHVPLNHLAPDQARFSVHNSLLAEAGVLGFEYGYSITRPEVLTLWEAQFGDFVNNAQSIVDLFIASGESKWQRLSGLVLLLPHGWEGLGPEHSSARLERFLQLCAENNLQVCHPTTPAQYFHLLRRQMKGRCRKPLVVMTPKSLLRHPLAVSVLAEMAGGGFREVLDDPESPAKPAKIIICSGKIYYQLLARTRQKKDRRTAILRLEQLYPFPEAGLKKMLSKYESAASWTWVQEEPENMGAWQFVGPRLERLTGRRFEYIGREAAASPATGFPAIYRQQQEAITDRALGKAV